MKILTENQQSTLSETEEEKRRQAEAEAEAEEREIMEKVFAILNENL